MTYTVFTLVQDTGQATLTHESQLPYVDTLVQDIGQATLTSESRLSYVGNTSLHLCKTIPKLHSFMS